MSTGTSGQVLLSCILVGQAQHCQVGSSLDETGLKCWQLGFSVAGLESGVGGLGWVLLDQVWVISRLDQVWSYWVFLAAQSGRIHCCRALGAVERGWAFTAWKLSKGVVCSAFLQQ